MADSPDLQLRMLEDRLRAERPQAPGRLVDAIAPAAPRPRAGAQRRQLGFAVALSATLVAALSAVGGVSYAANAVTHVASVAKQVVVTRVHVVRATPTAGGDQYKPGFGFGDPNHSHDGPPGLNNGNGNGGAGGGGGEKTPPTQAAPAPDGKAKITTAQISSDEQAAIYISVLDSDGNQLLLTQKGSKIGGSGVTGPQVKTIHYVMLVPRTIPLKLRIPANLLLPGHRYTIRVIAVDAQGNKSRVEIPFTS